MGFRNPITLLSELEADTLTGATIQTAEDGQRIVLDALNTIRFYTGDPDELSPGRIAGYDFVEGWPLLRVEAPELTVGGAAVSALELSINGVGGTKATAQLQAGSSEVLDILEGSGILLSRGRRIRAFDYGTYNDTTDAAGGITVPHDLGLTAVTVVATGGASGTNARVRVTARTATNFDLKFRNSATNVDLPAGSAVSGYWIALA